MEKMSLIFYEIFFLVFPARSTVAVAEIRKLGSLKKIHDRG
jgi:hypothetical protein